jgi:hypothetical protein
LKGRDVAWASVYLFGRSRDSFFRGLKFVFGITLVPDMTWEPVIRIGITGEIAFDEGVSEVRKNDGQLSF